MIKILPYSLMLLVFIPDCEPQYYLQENQGKPTQIVVSAYTQNGCLEELQQEAKNLGVEVKLTRTLGRRLVLGRFFCILFTKPQMYW